MKEGKDIFNALFSEEISLYQDVEKYKKDEQELIRSLANLFTKKSLLDNELVEVGKEIEKRKKELDAVIQSTDTLNKEQEQSTQAYNQSIRIAKEERQEVRDSIVIAKQEYENTIIALQSKVRDKENSVIQLTSSLEEKEDELKKLISLKEQELYEYNKPMFDLLEQRRKWLDTREENNKLVEKRLVDMLVKPK